MTADSDDGPSAWGRTLQEADEMAERLRADGWRVVTVRAGHVAPVPPNVGDTEGDTTGDTRVGDGPPDVGGHDEPERSGLVYVAPEDVAESLPDAVEAADLDSYEVFRRQVGNDLFLLTRVTDPEARVAVLLVGAVDLSTAGPLVEAAAERGVLRSHVRLLDGTHLLSVRHDDPAAFFPRLD